MKHSISIIIPTYNRPELIKKSLCYWSIYPISIIVLDGSQIASMNEQELSLYENVQYYHLPISLQERLSFAASNLSTSYAALISDDEFLTYSSLLEASKILDADSEVAAVLGVTLGFDIWRNIFVCKLHYESSINLDISGKTPKERLNQRLAVGGNSIYYPLVRVNVLKFAIDFISESTYSCPYITEYQMEAIFCAAGKVRVMPTLMWFRSFGVPMVTTPQYDRKILLVDWMRDSNNHDDLEKLKASASKHFFELSPGVNDLTGEYFINSYGLPSTKKNKFGSKNILQITKYIYSKLPMFFKEVVHTILYYLIGRMPGGMMQVPCAIKQLHSRKIKFDIEEIKRIEGIVLSNSIIVNDFRK